MNPISDLNVPRIFMQCFKWPAGPFGSDQVHLLRSLMLYSGWFSSTLDYEMQCTVRPKQRLLISREEETHFLLK